MFISRFFENPQEALIWCVIIIFSVCAHEYAHARMALFEGDDTAATQGHLTLNPLKQMGLMSLAMLAFCGIAWGQVPVNPSRMKSKFSHAKVAFAGPAMNLLLCLVSVLTIVILMCYNPNHTEAAPSLAVTMHFATIAAILNLVLFIFNMIPCFPLDGWTIFTSFIPFKMNNEAENIFSLVIFILIFSLSSQIFKYATLTISYIILPIYNVFHQFIN